MSNELTTTPPTNTVGISTDESDDRLVELWLHGRSPATQRGYRAETLRFRIYVAKPLRLATLGDLQGYADSLNVSELQPATVRRMLAAVKSLFAFGHRLGYLPFDTARPLRLPALRETLAERVIDESSLARMINLEPVARNAMMILLMYATGIRVSELVGLRWKNCQGRSGGEGQITVFGKGQKTRSILVGANVFTRLILLRAGASSDAFVFASRKGHGQLNNSHVLRVTKRAARRAGISRSVRNHDLRHSHASHSLEAGASISLVAQTLGHASIATTGRYLHARPGDSSGRYLSL